MFGEGSADRIEGAMDLERRGGWIGIQWIWRDGIGEKGGKDWDSMIEMDPTTQERDLELDAELDLVAR